MQKISITPVDTPTYKNIQPEKYTVKKNAILFYYSVEMHKFITVFIPGAPARHPSSARIRKMERRVFV